MKKYWKCIVGGLCLLPLIILAGIGIYKIIDGFVRDWQVSLIIIGIIAIFIFVSVKGMDLVIACIKDRKRGRPQS